MLEAKGIHKVYHNGNKQVHVLKGVDLKIEEGRFVVILGPSGAGKSTLLHILGGLDSPTKGKVVFEGSDMYRLNDQDISRIRNRRIGFVFQFYHLLSEFTVLENVLMPALINSGDRGQGACLSLPVRQAGGRQAGDRALELLNQVGLGERLTHFPSQLSAGERQRVAIVRALINRPGLLLCDEPTGNLDSKTGEEIASLIKKINQERRMAVILVTHNTELAKIADSVYHLRDGVLVN